MEFFDPALLDALAEGLANLPMFPFFEMAHYIMSVMAMREMPGALGASRTSPMTCWVSSMLNCFGGSVLSGIMLAQPPVEFLSNGTSVVIATLIWYLVFYSPMDFMYTFTSKLPVRVVLSGMKEVTRTFKIIDGVTQAQEKYADSLLIMIAVGWAKAAGGGFITNFEQLIRGLWRPETHEFLRMSYPVKLSLLGAVLFSLQVSDILPVPRNWLSLFFTTFIVGNKVHILITGKTTSPFSTFESAMVMALFTGIKGDDMYLWRCTETKRRTSGKDSKKGKTSRSRLSTPTMQGRKSKSESDEDRF